MDLRPGQTPCSAMDLGELGTDPDPAVVNLLQRSRSQRLGPPIELTVNGGSRLD